jgi:hypothetical protein
MRKRWIARCPILAVAGLLWLVAVSAEAGGLRIGVAELDPPSDGVPDQSIAAIIINDFLPSNLEKAFAERYGITPIISSIPAKKGERADELIRRASETRAFDVLIIPEATQLGSSSVYKFRVADLRRELSNVPLIRSFAAIPDQAGARGLEVAVSTASERIASSIIGRGSTIASGVPGGLDGLVRFWCIVPASNLGPSAQLAAADLTINLPSSIAEAAKTIAPRLNFIGLGHTEYFYECRSTKEGNVPAQSVPLRDANYILSGQLLASSPNEPSSATLLRVFAEDRTIGRTFTLLSVSLSSPGEVENLEELGKKRDQLGKQILESFISAVKRSP